MSPQQEACDHLDVYVEAFRDAMVSADTLALMHFADSHLSFGHSNGVIQSREDFVEMVASGDEVFRSIELTDKFSDCDGSIATERHVFSADILVKGEPLRVMLSVLEVWRYDGDRWLLVARQAFKT